MYFGKIGEKAQQRRGESDHNVLIFNIFQQQKKMLIPQHLYHFCNNLSYREF